MFPLKRRPGLKSDEFPGAGSGDASEAPEADDIERFKAWFKASRDHWHDWHEQAREDFAFVAGDQWSPEDIGLLREQMRPVVTFNRIGPFIDSVEGHEINNRTELRFIPRTLGDSGVNELLTGAAKWVRDECDAEDEETAAFVDMVICGMGWTDTRPTYDNDPDGEIVIERVDPLEMYPDPSARKGNLADMQYCFRVKQVPIQTARQQFPEFSDDELDAKWARSYLDDDKQPHDAMEAPFYRNDQSGEVDKQRQKATLVEVQWWEYETAWRVADPATGKMVRLSGDDYEQLQKRVKIVNGLGGSLKLKAVRDRQKCYYKAVLGNVVLEESEGADEGGFTWKAMTAKRDRNKGTWYGLVRGMKDPQRWANKWLAQTMHTINTNSKGGILAEEDAFSNPREAADTWASPDSITFVKSGALVQGKIKDKPQINYPMGLDRLMDFAIQAIPQTSGINPDMLGQATSQQPGVASAEIGRRQQAMAILAGMFNAKRRYVKEQGRLLLWMIQTFISDGRLVRIGGQENAQYVPLVRDPQTARYDVIVDDTPTSPNMKERVFGLLMQMMPALQNLGLPPSAWLEALKYSPFPETLTAKWTQAVEQAQQAASQNPAQQAFANSENAKAQLHQADAAKKMAEAQAIPAQHALQQQREQASIELTRAQAVKALTDAHVAQRGQQLDEASAAVDTLLRGQQQAHGQDMDRQQSMQPMPQNPA